jgi:hypothetical protein
MMNEPKGNSKPACFGDLNIVFPPGSDGLRVTPEGCMRCIQKTLCLRSAMSGGRGLKVREEMIERAYRGGVIGFFQRWSQKKAICRMRQNDSAES